MKCASNPSAATPVIFQAPELEIAATAGFSSVAAGSHISLTFCALR
jgi:hypothetical protein